MMVKKLKSSAPYSRIEKTRWLSFKTLARHGRYQAAARRKINTTTIFSLPRDS
jgi:hypothetical protein